VTGRCPDGPSTARAAALSPTHFAGGGHGRHALPPASRLDSNVSNLELNAAIRRLHQLDDEDLGAFSQQLDEAIKGRGRGPLDEDMDTAVSLAGAARILLRRRRATDACTRANAIIHNLLSASETRQ
jgi:hypothetical protein